MKFLLAVITALLISIPSSGAAQAGDPIDNLIDWKNIETVYRCSPDRSGIYANSLNQIHGETELFLGETTISVYNRAIRRYELVNGVLGVFVNQDSGSFTLAILFDNGSFCELLIGRDFMPYTFN